MSGKSNELSHEQVQKMIDAAVAKSREEYGVETRLAFSEFEKDFSQKIADSLEGQLESKLSSYFGRVEAHEHITDHFRLKKLLDFFENFSSSVWKSVLTFALKSLGFVGVIYIVFSLVGPVILKNYITERVKAETPIVIEGK